MAIEGIRDEGVSNFVKPEKQTRPPVANRATDPFILDLLCKMVVTDNKMIRRSQLLNVQQFLDRIPVDEITRDEKARRYIDFIRRGLEARLEYNLTNPEMIMHHINGGIIIENQIIDLSNFRGLANNEIEWINAMVSENLAFTHIDSEVDNVLDVCTRFKTRDYNTAAVIVKEVEAAISNLQNKFRQSRNETHVDAMFNLAEGDFQDCVRDAYNQIANPKRKLLSGMQGLNELLGGGFEDGRVYVFFGLPGEGKSALLVNLMYQIKKYNKDYKCKDPTKIPCVVLLTMENVVTETTERVFSVATGNESMIDYEVDDVIQMMRVDGGLTLDEANPVNIIVKYMPTGSIDTSYLYTLCEDLEDQGYEVIAMIQDYIARIRSTQHFQETRFEYGAVIDEFKTFAQIKDIPVITASQLNRDAARHIDENRQQNKNDLVRSLGRSNISESILILNNTDAGFMLAPEMSQEGEKYMGIQRVKIRYRASTLESVYIPFVHNGIKLSEDLGLPPTYRTTLREKGFEDTYAEKSTMYQTNAIYDMNTNTVAPTDNIENIFNGANFISGDQPTQATNMDVLMPMVRKPYLYDSCDVFDGPIC